MLILRRPILSICLIFGLLCLKRRLDAQTLNLPIRPPDAPVGSAFAKSISDLPLPSREEKIAGEVLRGNVPSFLRKLVPIPLTNVVDGITNTATLFVAPDYLAVGSEDDYFYTPLTPFTAQKIADQLNCSLPTPRIVDAIYNQAPLKLIPTPIPPTPKMVTVPFFAEHNKTVLTQRNEQLKQFPLGTLVAGHKKDVVISKKLLDAPKKVAIYGWHKSIGNPIQPVFTGHTAAWADYSHGIRLVQKQLTVNGASKTWEEVLANEKLASLLSGEGVLTQPRYVLAEFPKEATKASSSPAPRTKETIVSTKFDEETTTLHFDPQVRVQINAPSAKTMSGRKKLLLIFYTLPNGNTIEQTVGKQLTTGDDWHFDIQHIGAQTRFLRNKIQDENIVIAYLENELKSWPAWRKKYGDADIAKIIGAIESRYTNYDTSVVLSGHSGGGSCIFGYINTQTNIPTNLERIAFLDANYAYETALHHDKLAQWLTSKERPHYLSVLAYNDAVALLNGKTFVSAAGGTWGKSHLMLEDFSKDFPFTRDLSANPQQFTALDGRIKFLLKENPEKKVLHTRQVELNGFIQTMVSGTPLERKGYTYFGDRAYTNLISAE